MDDIERWYPMMVLTLATGLIVSFTTAFFYSTHITKNHFDEILAAVKNSQHLHSDMRVKALGGFSRKILAARSLYGALSSTRLLSAEYLSLEDIKNFPPHLLSLLAKEKLFHDITLVLFLSACSIIPLKP